MGLGKLLKYLTVLLGLGTCEVGDVDFFCINLPLLWVALQSDTGGLCADRQRLAGTRRIPDRR